MLDNQTITGIGDYAFSIAGKIAILTLPSTLKTIGNGVFEGHALTSLDIPSGVTSIGYRAFYGNALSNINLPSGLVSIADETFANNQLTSLTLPGGIKTIGNSAFTNNKIVSLIVPNSVETIGWQAFSNNRISVLTFQAPCQLKEISSWCFSGNDIRNLIIPNSILIIGDGAFQSNTNLSNVTFGTSILKIKRGAFNSCNLSSVNLPGSLVFIGRYAFEGNYNLINFKLPTSGNNYKWNDSNGVQHNAGDIVNDKYYSYVAIIPYTLKDNDVVVENGIIINCTYFNDITHIASVITIPDKLDGQDIVGIGGSVFYDRGISELILPAGITNIDNGAFQRNEIIHITLPNSLETIGERAFNDNCINSITFDAKSKLQIIGSDAFGSNRIISIDFPGSIIKIGKYAFAYNWLQSINFEENSQLISIGSHAFEGNWQLLNITLPNPTINGYNHWVDWDNNEYSSNLTVSNFESFYKIPIEYTLTNEDVVVIDGVIVSCTPSNQYANILTIPDILDGQKIVGIGQEVYRNMGLIGVNLPSFLRIIDYSAFLENEIITLTIPGSVEVINGNAFSGNNINKLIFEENSKLRQIGGWAFSNNKISSITLPDNLNYIDWGAFSSNKISDVIIIPDGVEYIGGYAFLSNQIPQVIFGVNSILAYLGEYAFANNIISNEIFIPYTLTEISDYAFQNNNISKIKIHPGIVEYGNGAFENNNSSLKIVLGNPPTIPYVTHFFGWKNNDGIYYDSGVTIPDFGNRYKAVIDQFFVVKFIVEDDNNEPIEYASIQIYNSTLTTDINGIDSIGPVMRGLQNFTVSGVSGCSDFAGSIDVQDNMTVIVTLTRFYIVNINIVDIDNKPISGAEVVINDSNLISGTKGNVSLNLPDGDYPFVINAPGYKEYPDSLTVLDADNSIIVKLVRVVVNYFPNGGIGESISVTTSATTHITTRNPFTRTAYTFTHWNSIANDSGTTYMENQSILLGYSDFDFYAIWTPVNYNIIYHLNGGTNNSGNPTIYNIESEINLFPASKPSLYFAAWIDADGNRVSRIETGNTGDIELWAVFTTEPTYYIDYYNLENASHNNQSTYTKFDLSLLFTDAIKNGYEFIAWYEDSLLTKQITSIPVGSTKNYDIYAKWGGAYEYEITYSLDGGINYPTNPTKYTIESDRIIFGLPTKTGAKFIAWYSDNEFATEITDIAKGSFGDTTLYAKWDLNIFNIKYVLDGGFNNPVNPTKYTIESPNIIFEPPTKPGAKFIAWYSDKDLTKEITKIEKGSFGDATLYASWELDNFDIQYLLDGGNNNPANPAKYTIESDKIIFESPTRVGANFVAWYSDKNLINEIVNIPQGTTGDTTIYAKWNLDIFDIKYVLNGGDNNPANPAIYTIESNKITFESPAKTGAKFIAWYNDKDLTTEITEIAKGSFGDITIYAKWELEIFDIHYILDGGINNPANPAYYTIESDTIIFEPPIKTGEKFIAWYCDKDLLNEITEIPKGSLGDTAIYATWELDTFNIHYVLEGGNNNPANPAKYTIESSIIHFENPDRGGYIFDGWYTNSNHYDRIDSVPEGSVGDTTIYAKWLEIFNVKFIITTDGVNPAKDIDIVIDNSRKLKSDISGLADTLMADGSSLEYSIEINGIVIEYGLVNVSGDVTIIVEIVDCYMRWYDIIFCDNGKGLWTNFVWFKDNVWISNEQFYHNQGGIENGKYKLSVTSIAGVEYIWEKDYNKENFWQMKYNTDNSSENEYKSDEFEVNMFPNPVNRNSTLNINLSESINLQTAKIFIYNVNGAIIMKVNNPLYMNEINIDNKFSSGLYHVVIIDNKSNQRAVLELIVK